MTTNEQISFLPKRVPDDVVAEAREGQNVIASYCLFSGGNDSTVLAHRCKDYYEALIHIDTGTAVPGVRDFCEEFAEWLGKELIVYEADDAYRILVLGSDDLRSNGKPKIGIGFPGPAQHGRCYVELKERQIDTLVRVSKILNFGAPRNARILLLTGIRQAESTRRKGREAWSVAGAKLWCNPLIDWTARDMWDYRDLHMKDAPMSDVAALLHRSGECNCGAYAAPGEREELQALFPEWFDATIGALEEEARAAGLPSAVWGSRPERIGPVEDEFMCSDCQLRIEEA